MLAFRQYASYLVLTIVLTILNGSILADEAVPNHAEFSWWRGNIHTHSLWSDGDDFPEMISEWYRTHDYNFLAISDHNVLAQGQRWMKLETVEKRGGPTAMQKYLDRYGDDWVEVRGEGAQSEVRLKPFNDYRSLIEERGKFILLQGEEISDSVGGKPIHMNVTNIHERTLPLSGETVPKAIEANLRAVEEQAKKLGQEMIVHLNHPNFGYAVTPEELAEVVSERFFEVYNGHRSVNQLGDGKHVSIERMWDIANSIRLVRYAAAPLMGVATDDSHHYHGGENSPGRGWIMVRARHLTPESLIRSMKRGDFYASSGVALNSVTFDDASKQLRVDIASEPGVTYETQFVGTRKFADDVKPDDLDPAKMGIVLQTSKDKIATYTLKGDELYVRAQIVSSKPHPNASHDDQFETAWTQPFGWTADDVKQ